MKKYLAPGLFLLLLAPVLGELVSGHQTLWEFINPLNFLILSLPYGFGAIICRELRVRWGKGWLSLVLLGTAFGIYEEALVARSFWDPVWSELGALQIYSHWKGVNWLFAEMMVHFHITISILSSVLLSELVYPERRNEAWLGPWGFVACCVGLALWMPALMWINPYIPPWWGFVFSGVAIIALGYAAWKLPAKPFPPRDGSTMPPVGYGLVAALITKLFFVEFFFLQSKI
jgi:hypothetical protein